MILVSTNPSTDIVCRPGVSRDRRTPVASPASRLASLQGEMRPQPACICLNAIRLHRFLTDSELRLCIARSTARVAASVSTVTRQQANCVTGATRVPTVLRASAPVLSGLPRQPPLQALCSQTENNQPVQSRYAEHCVLKWTARVQPVNRPRPPPQAKTGTSSYEA